MAEHHLRCRQRSAPVGVPPDALETSRIRARALRRGFTLVELSIVVVIIGVMATLATYGVSRYIRQSKTAEAAHMIGAIKAGQEAFFDETFRYYDVSGTLDNLYPKAGTAGRDKAQWGGDEEAKAWATIGIAPAAPVLFRYATIAGNGTPNDSLLGEDGLDYNLAAAPAGHWYLVKAVADLDGDGKARSVFVGSSFTSEIHAHNAGE